MKLNSLAPKSLLGTVLVCIILSTAIGCEGAAPSARAALDAAKLFVDTLTLLNDASQLYQSNVSKAVTAAKTELAVAEEKSSEVKIDLPKIALEWEQNWKKVNEQTAELEKRFKDVEIASNKYWETLERVTNAIGDAKLREQEKKKNRDAKQKWDEAYQNAKKQIDKARALRDKGNDFHKLMIAAALRRQLAEYTATLDSIAQEAESLLKSLEALTEQGKSIVSLNP